MALLNKISLEVISKKGQSVTKSLLTKRVPQILNPNEIKYVPSQLACDTFSLSSNKDVNCQILNKEMLENLLSECKSFTEIAKRLNLPASKIIYILKKFGIYKPTKPSGTREIILEEKILQKLVKEKKTLNEMATELNVPVGKIRYYLNKYNINLFSLECKYLKEYFSATTPEAKEKAFVEIDKYLQQIAKEEVKLRQGEPYEDCLQDVRLRFLEQVEKEYKGKIIGSNNILDRVRQSMPKESDKIETRRLDIKTDDVAVDDKLTKFFEDTDFIESLIKKTDYPSRKEFILQEFVLKDKTLAEIGEYLGLTTQRVKKLLNMALDEIKGKYTFINSNKYIEQRLNFTKRSIR